MHQSIPAAGQPLEVARFCDHVVVDSRGGTIDLVWADPRDMASITITFTPGAPVQDAGPAPVKHVAYWKHSWPERRPVPGVPDGSGQSGWTPQDDWYKGSWRVASFTQVVSAGAGGLSVSCTFEPLGPAETRVAGFPVTYRRAVKVRVVLDPATGLGPGDIDHVKVHTTSRCLPVDIMLDVDPARHPGCRRMTAHAWNGSWDEGGSPVDATARDSAPGEPLRIHAVRDRDHACFDETIVTVVLDDGCTCSFSVDDVVARGQVPVPSLGMTARVATCPAGTVKDASSRTVHAMVGERDEQGLDRALHAFAGKVPMHFILGCEGTRSKGALSRSGSLFSSATYIRKVPGPDTPGVCWMDGFLAIQSRFSVDGVEMGPDLSPRAVERTRAGGFLPVMTARWVLDGGIEVEQDAFATLLGRTIPGCQPAATGDVVVMDRRVVVNAGTAPRVVALQLLVGQAPAVDDTIVPVPVFTSVDQVPLHGSRTVLARLLAPSGKGYCFLVNPGEASVRLHAGSGSHHATIELVLDPGTRATIQLAFPLLGLAAAGNTSRCGLLLGLDHDRERLRNAIYWDDRAGDGASIVVPDDTVSTFWNAHLVHVLLTNDKAIGSDRILGRVGSLQYGTYANEVCMITMNLDRRGLFDEARRVLDTFLAFQGTAGLLGDYEEIDGIFFGAGGYERGEGYNQNQGFVLWAIADHVRLSGDVAWFRANAGKVVLGCDWITRERRARARQEPAGEGPEARAGLLPPGGVEDVTDFWHWLATNAYNAFGLAQAACLLVQTGHPDGDRVMADALDYIGAVRSAFWHAMERAPVVPLRDGTFVPHFPSKVTRRGRSFGWIQETLEGAMHLVRCWIVHPLSMEATWILQDHEDNLYLSERFGYPVSREEFEARWFDIGGFSQQPFLLCNQWPYLVRGEPKHYLRAVFNAFAVNYRPDTRSFVEHPLPTMMDVRGDFFKTSDEANFCTCLRDMIVHETSHDMETAVLRGDAVAGTTPAAWWQGKLGVLGGWDRLDALWIARATPRDWLRDGQTITASRLPTYHGEATIELRASDGGAIVDVEITLDRGRVRQVNGPLRSIIISLRLPGDGHFVKSVERISFSINARVQATPPDVSLYEESVIVLDLQSCEPADWQVLAVHLRARCGLS